MSSTLTRKTTFQICLEHFFSFVSKINIQFVFHQDSSYFNNNGMPTTLAHHLLHPRNTR